MKKRPDREIPHLATREEWLEKRLELLKREKELTRLRDEITKERQSLPWVAVENQYAFQDSDGEYSLLELFGHNSQLIVYHFMYSPNWAEGCTSCSFWADNFNGIDVHLDNRDISFLAVSNSSTSVLKNYSNRFGWNFKWVSTNGSSFSNDFHVTFGEEEKDQNRIHYNYVDQEWYTEELPGVSVFIRDQEDNIYHTYSTYARGLDILNGAYHYMDLTPKGRDEDNGMSWLRRRDQYA